MSFTIPVSLKIWKRSISEFSFGNISFKVHRLESLCYHLPENLKLAFHNPK